MSIMWGGTGPRRFTIINKIFKIKLINYRISGKCVGGTGPRLIGSYVNLIHDYRYMMEIMQFLYRAFKAFSTKTSHHNILNSTKKVQIYVFCEHHYTVDLSKNISILVFFTTILVRVLMKKKGNH